VLFDMILTAPIHPATVSESRTVFLPWPEAQVLIESKLQQVTAATTPARALESRSPRELSRDDVTALLRFGDGATPSLVGGLVSGLTGSEIRRLCWSHLDLAESLIRVPGEDSRILPLAPAATRMLAQLAPPASQPSAPVWSNGHGVPLTSAAIDSLIVSAAYVAGLDAPTEVDAETLRFTYIAYLVRQGLPLDQLPGLVGHISPAARSQCGLLSPPDPGVTIENLQRVYPALA
jgi:integrase